MKIKIELSNVDRATETELKYVSNAEYERRESWWNNGLYIYSHTANKKKLKEILKSKKFRGYGVNVGYCDAYQIGKPRGIYIYTEIRSEEDGVYTWHDSDLTRHNITFRFKRSYFFSHEEIQKEQQRDNDIFCDVFGE